MRLWRIVQRLIIVSGNGQQSTVLDFSRDHFTLFGLPASYVLDGARLDQAYRDVQARIHPDKFVHAGAAEQRLSMQWATRVNEAYQTLRRPFGRANYLLQLQGIQAMDSSVMPMDFLERHMDWSEELAQARGAQDVAALGRLEQALRGEARAFAGQTIQVRRARHAVAVAAEDVARVVVRQQNGNLFHFYHCCWKQYSLLPD